MTGFLIGTISDLSQIASISICFLTAPHNEKSEKWIGRSFRSRWWTSIYPNYGILKELQDEPPSNVKRTDGIAACPLNRLRTRLSIPFGFLHAASTHLYVSLWWRLKRFVPNILEKLSKILSPQATRNLAEDDRRRCDREDGSVGFKFLHTLLHYLYVLPCCSHLCTVISISKVLTSRNGCTPYCDVWLNWQFQQRTNNFNSLRWWERRVY